MDYRELIHIWLVGAPNKMIAPFYRFKDGRELENFPIGENK